MPENNEIPETEDGPWKILLVAKEPVDSGNVICRHRNAQHRGRGVRVRFPTIHAEVKPLTININLSKKGVGTSTIDSFERSLVQQAEGIVRQSFLELLLSTHKFFHRLE